MRTYLTRLTMTAAGAVLTGVSLAGLAHAGENDEVFVDPSVLENLELEPCDEITASDDMLFPVDPGWEPGDLAPPTEPDDPEAGQPWGEFELVPCLQIPTDDEDEDGGDGNGDDGDDQEPGDNDDQEPGNGDGGDDGNGGGGSGGQADGPSDQSSGDPSGDANDGVGDEDSDETGDDQTSQQDDVTPVAATGGGDDSTLMLAVLAGVLGTVGLLILIYGLRKRPRRGQQPA